MATASWPLIGAQPADHQRVGDGHLQDAECGQHDQLDECGTDAQAEHPREHCRHGHRMAEGHQPGGVFVPQPPQQHHHAGIGDPRGQPADHAEHVPGPFAGRDVAELEDENQRHPQHAERQRHEVAPGNRLAQQRDREEEDPPGRRGLEPDGVGRRRQGHGRQVRDAHDGENERQGHEATIPARPADHRQQDRRGKGRPPERHQRPADRIGPVVEHARLDEQAAGTPQQRRRQNPEPAGEFATRRGRGQVHVVGRRSISKCRMGNPP